VDFAYSLTDFAKNGQSSHYGQILNGWESPVPGGVNQG